MSCGSGGKTESIFTCEGFPPIEFGDFSSRKSPMFEMETCAESGDDMFYFFTQSDHGANDFDSRTGYPYSSATA